MLRKCACEKLSVISSTLILSCMAMELLTVQSTGFSTTTTTTTTTSSSSSSPHSLFGVISRVGGGRLRSRNHNHLRPDHHHHHHHCHHQQKKEHSNLFSSTEKRLRPRSYIASGIMASSTVTEEHHQNSRSSTSKDLLVVGPGVLGRLVAGLWMKEHSNSSIVGQTVTTTHHDELLSLGIRPVVKSNQDGTPGFPYVIFCAPPSGSLDYAGEIRSAAEQWNGEGVFLFTSSSAVYDCNDNGACDEDTPIVPLGRSPRTDVLLRAEQEVLNVNGAVLRLAGLYTLERGPHAYYAKKGTVDARPDHILNLIHYEDAASLCVNILKKGFRKEVFMGCDNHPVSRQELMEIAKKSGKFSFDSFTVVDGPLGKRMNCDKTRARIEWQPKFKSFAEFLGVTEE